MSQKSHSKKYNTGGAMTEDPAGLAATTQCQRCKHFGGWNEKEEAINCKAYPAGIPEVLLFDEEPHTGIRPGQTGAYIYSSAE
jgi:hypothetical protein